jgi:hypothetical protein
MGVLPVAIGEKPSEGVWTQNWEIVLSRFKDLTMKRMMTMKSRLSLSM